jgi:hypothetical protein
MPPVPDDQRWREVLDKAAGARRAATARGITDAIAGIGARCAVELAAGRGCRGLPALLDLELHALSVRMGRWLTDDAVAVTGAVGAALFGGAAQDPPVLARLRSAVADAIESESDSPQPTALLGDRPPGGPRRHAGAHRARGEPELLPDVAAA